ncbi:helix-turn-helix domain-containing protein [Parenemella sanctibonifatiensis]|uniref:helix-turn-helix domain-containing protein n=1 Tax=Parenemella sanctibonifatiensis TaxID=2016505 RepID=UPI001E524944|nr:helix-turn-helix domain-containing protein [Parenemella sanctibonifatiensis]
MTQHPRWRRRERIAGQARIDLAAEVARRYGVGESIRSIADDLGRSFGFVQGLLAESDVTRRSRGGVMRGPVAQQRRAEVAQAVADLKAGGFEADADALESASDAVKSVPTIKDDEPTEKKSGKSKKDKSGKKKSGKKGKKKSKKS